MGVGTAVCDVKQWERRLLDGSVIVALLGLVFVVGGVSLWFFELRPRTGARHRQLFDLVMHVLFGGVVLAMGVHVERSDLPERERFAVIVWCYGGFTLMFALSVLGHLGPILSGVLTLAFVSDFVVFASLGAAFGAVAGVNSGRAIRTKRLAERNREQSETLALLTRLLSHDIRNDLSVIMSHAELLESRVDEESRERVARITDRIDGSTALLEDASALVETLDEETDFEVIDLSAVLHDEVAAVRGDHGDVEIRTAVADDLTVSADGLVNQLFRNLLQNAVSHNDESGLEIEVAAERREDDIEVVVSDNGRGIDPAFREHSFELGEQGPDSGGDGIGLYLVSRLADVYGGDVSVDESPSGGARFRIRLPAIDD
jgi:signal transduction histidine kinase